MIIRLYDDVLDYIQSTIQITIAIGQYIPGVCQWKQLYNSERLKGIHYTIQCKKVKEVYTISL